MQHLPDVPALKAAANTMKAESEGRQTVAKMKWQMATNRRAEAERTAALAEGARSPIKQRSRMHGVTLPPWRPTAKPSVSDNRSSTGGA